jgi:hypothetical protein
VLRRVHLDQRLREHRLFRGPRLGVDQQRDAVAEAPGLLADRRDVGVTRDRPERHHRVRLDAVHRVFVA